jgi:hypothetical protein
MMLLKSTPIWDGQWRGGAARLPTSPKFNTSKAKSELFWGPGLPKFVIENQMTLNHKTKEHKTSLGVG